MTHYQCKSDLLKRMTISNFQISRTPSPDSTSSSKKKNVDNQESTHRILRFQKNQRARIINFHRRLTPHSECYLPKKALQLSEPLSTHLMCAMRLHYIKRVACKLAHHLRLLTCTRATWPTLTLRVRFMPAGRIPFMRNLSKMKNYCRLRP